MGSNPDAQSPKDFALGRFSSFMDAVRAINFNPCRNGEHHSKFSRGIGRRLYAAVIGYRYTSLAWSTISKWSGSHEVIDCLTPDQQRRFGRACAELKDEVSSGDWDGYSIDDFFSEMEGAIYAQFPDLLPIASMIEKREGKVRKSLKTFRFPEGMPVYGCSLNGNVVTLAYRDASLLIVSGSDAGARFRGVTGAAACVMKGRARHGWVALKFDPATVDFQVDCDALMDVSYLVKYDNSNFTANKIPVPPAAIPTVLPPVPSASQYEELPTLDDFWAPLIALRDVPVAISGDSDAEPPCEDDAFKGFPEDDLPLFAFGGEVSDDDLYTGNIEELDGAPHDLPPHGFDEGIEGDGDFFPGELDDEGFDASGSLCELDEGTAKRVVAFCDSGDEMRRLSGIFAELRDGIAERKGAISELERESVEIKRRVAELEAKAARVAEDLEGLRLEKVAMQKRRIGVKRRVQAVSRAHDDYLAKVESEWSEANERLLRDAISVDEWRKRTNARFAAVALRDEMKEDMELGKKILESPKETRKTEDAPHG